mmetsp:Transcript_5576/g.15687  ORF Transcript_5576/g.15687 Transcript_5576/m.15687 type:complete len:166 (+) Transcript_5576:223-720(+)
MHSFCQIIIVRFVHVSSDNVRAACRHVCEGLRRRMNTRSTTYMYCHDNLEIRLIIRLASIITWFECGTKTRQSSSQRRLLAKSLLLGATLVMIDHQQQQARSIISNSHVSWFAGERTSSLAINLSPKTRRKPFRRLPRRGGLGLSKVLPSFENFECRISARYQCL